MCTLALYLRVFEDYPIVVAANRDEHYDRPSAPPAVLSSNPRMIAGKDLRIGGTWLGVNEHGLVAAILNRRPETNDAIPANVRSRGLLCLDLLKHQSAAEARGSLADERNAYQPFTVVFSDAEQGWVAFNVPEKIETTALSQGLHVFSSSAKHNETSEKKERAYSLFSDLVPALNENLADFSAWVSIFKRVLSDHAPGSTTGDRKESICVHAGISGTVSSSIVIYSARERQFTTFFCEGPPCENDFGRSLTLGIK